MTTHPDTTRTRSCCGGHAADTGLAPGRGAEAAVNDAVVLAALALLEQCGSFVGALPDTAYTADSRTIKGGTIGKHVRHVLDHYAAILVGVESATPIDYDHRERDVPMETRRQSALDGVEHTRRRLRGLSVAQLDGPVRVRVMLACDGAEAELGSTLARELAFATHHAVHHHAMIRAIAEEQGVAPAAEFGKAPSTLSYEHRVVTRPAGMTPVARPCEGSAG